VAFDLEQQCTAFVVISIYRYADPPRFGGRAILAVRWWPRQCRAGFDKSDAVEPAHKINDIAAGFAAAAIENLFLDIDGKPIVTAAFWAWPIAFGLAEYLDIASGELILNMNRACAINPGLVFDRPHVNSSREKESRCENTGFRLIGNVVVEGMDGFVVVALTVFVGVVGDQLCRLVGFDAPAHDLKERSRFHAELGFHLAGLQLDDRHRARPRIAHQLDLRAQITKADAAAGCRRAESKNLGADWID